MVIMAVRNIQPCPAAFLRWLEGAGGDSSCGLRKRVLIAIVEAPTKRLFRPELGTASRAAGRKVNWMCCSGRHPQRRALRRLQHIAARLRCGHARDALDISRDRLYATSTLEVAGFEAAVPLGWLSGVSCGLTLRS
jgi:hypothetical protein